jgi:hypothetical protein
MTRERNEQDRETEKPDDFVRLHHNDSSSNATTAAPDRLDQLRPAL